MKKVITLILLLPLMVIAQDKYCQVKGKFSELKSPAKVYLISGYGWTNEKIMDSTVMVDGAFVFERKLSEPKLVSLVINPHTNGYEGWRKDANAIDLYLEEGKILVSGLAVAKTAKVEGGLVNEAYDRYKKMVLSKVDDFNTMAQAKLKNLSPTALNDTKLMKSLIDSSVGAYQTLIAQVDTLKAHFIIKYPHSFVSLTALKELAVKSEDLPKLKSLYGKLSPDLTKLPSGKALAQQLFEAGTTAIGSVAPDFTQNDVLGNPIKLSSFKGRYVLIDFWASWCAPCRAENPYVVAAYQQFKERKFTVLGISLDDASKKDAWLAAIQADKLPWTQVSDLKGWNNEVARLYGVRAIPQNFLIDPDGRIIAKNLRGEALSEKLASILK